LEPKRAGREKSVKIKSQRDGAASKQKKMDKLKRIRGLLDSKEMPLSEGEAQLV
jgi:hypothetical protein